eukprot:EC097230.1.p1 GENE.EC097230.1~~EC097230.1.p1  ORF type:complete len:186 (+),score=-14.59 EC097230.1:158-715(+)
MKQIISICFWICREIKEIMCKIAIKNSLLLSLLLNKTSTNLCLKWVIYMQVYSYLLFAHLFIMIFAVKQNQHQFVLKMDNLFKQFSISLKICVCMYASIYSQKCWRSVETTIYQVDTHFYAGAQYQLTTLQSRGEIKREINSCFEVGTDSSLMCRFNLKFLALHLLSCFYLLCINLCIILTSFQK